MTLQYQNIKRIETNPDIIQTLLRKGWIQIPDEIKPVVLPYVPETISLWAFRSILTLQGLITQAEALIDSLSEPAKTVATIQWEYGNYIDRNHPLIASLGSQLGLTSEQIDNIFIEADKLS